MMHLSCQEKAGKLIALILRILSLRSRMNQKLQASPCYGIPPKIVLPLETMDLRNLVITKFLLHSSRHMFVLWSRDYLDPEHRSNKEYLYDHYLSKAFLFDQMLPKGRPKLSINQGKFS